MHVEWKLGGRGVVMGTSDGSDGRGAGATKPCDCPHQARGVQGVQGVGTLQWGMGYGPRGRGLEGQGSS